MCKNCESLRSDLAGQVAPQSELFVSVISDAEVLNQARADLGYTLRAPPNLGGFGYQVVSEVGGGSRSTNPWVVRAHDTGQTFLAKCVSLADLSFQYQELAKQEASL